MFDRRRVKSFVSRSSRVKCSDERMSDRGFVVEKVRDRREGVSSRRSVRKEVSRFKISFLVKRGKEDGSVMVRRR